LKSEAFIIIIIITDGYCQTACQEFPALLTASFRNAMIDITIPLRSRRKRRCAAVGESSSHQAAAQSHVRDESGVHRYDLSADALVKEKQT
jgi:hypothetical protein